MADGCPSVRAHGTMAAYKHRGCRCPEAVAAMRAHWRNGYRRSKAPDPMAVERLVAGDAPEGASRRERRLAAARLLELTDWPARRIGERVGYTARSVYRIRRAMRDGVAA